MMGNKKLAEIKAELAASLAQLPGPSPEAWLTKEIKSAKQDPARDETTLRMLLTALEREVNKRRKRNPRRRAARR